jgi:hypothetical protein
MIVPPKTKRTEFPIVKSYESNLEGENVKLLMYRHGRRYGVVTLFPDAAVTADYQHNETNELRTLIGNECSIIDWVSMEEANQRYARIAMKLLHRVPFDHVACDKSKPRKLQLVASN